MSKKLLDEVFPLQKHILRSLHKRVKGEFDIRPAYAYCAWTFQHLLTGSKKMTYSKAVSRTSFCATTVTHTYAKNVSICFTTLLVYHPHKLYSAVAFFLLFHVETIKLNYI